MPIHIAALLAGAALDLLVGDPEWFPHPVRLVGRFIAFAERRARRGNPSPAALRRRGAVLAAVTVLLTAGASAGILYLLGLWGFWPRFAGMALMSWTCLCARNLADEAEGVRRALAASLEAGRRRVARIVGRDTEGLDEPGVLRAVIETVAENLTDGVVSPMLYLALGGPVLGMAFKAASTLDSMIGYLDERYRDVGRFAARADDVWNWVPARVAALTMCLAAFPLGLDGRRALFTVRRDHGNHLSPNCAWTEAAAAGALGVMLGGDHTYFGKLVRKPTIGDDVRPPEREDIRRMNRLMILSAGIVMGAIVGIAAIIWTAFH